MALNTVSEIIALGRINLDEFPQSEIELALEEADDEITLRVPPLSPGERGWDRYVRRLPLIKQAEGYLALSYAYKRLSYDTITHAEPGDPFGALGLNFGAKTPEINTIADYYRKLSDDYRTLAEPLIKQCRVIVPQFRRPRAISLGDQ